MFPNQASVIPGLSQEQIQNLSVGQELCFTRQDPVPECSFKVEVKVIEIQHPYRKCWVEVTKIIKMEPKCNIGCGRSLLADFEELSVL